MKSKLLLCLALILGGGLFCHATDVSHTDDEQYWSAKVASVKMGMMRADVEKILPVWPGHNSPGPGESSTIDGAGQSAMYWVSEHWLVIVFYDSLKHVNAVLGLTNEPYNHPVAVFPSPAVTNAPSKIDPVTGLPYGYRMLLDPNTGLPLEPK
jgi:hypothetical protein